MSTHKRIQARRRAARTPAAPGSGATTAKILGDALSSKANVIEMAISDFLCREPSLRAHQTLTQATARLMWEGLAFCSRKQERTALRSFLRFLGHFHIPFSLPPSPQLLASYVTYSTNIARKPISHKSVSGYIRTLSMLCDELSIPTSPFSATAVKRAIRGAAKRSGPSSTQGKLPLTIQLLASLEHVISNTDNTEHVIMAAASASVFGALRGSEVSTKRMEEGTHFIMRGHVTWHRDYVDILILFSKTDQDETGFTIHIWRVNAPCCAWKWMRRVWSSAPAVAPWAPLFQLPSGKPLTYSFYNKQLKAILQRLPSSVILPTRERSALPLHFLSPAYLSTRYVCWVAGGHGRSRYMYVSRRLISNTSPIF
eukprot:gb/GEZN01009443.1/.p1 GENE.gb/GEZN01009443.1/~~gb/GEZN01009443.1/.p1  ORF type:complete len:370 (+),score=19.37 gb/GEZN01009443.1/:158-1267(+)